MLTVAEIMTPNPASVAPGTSLGEVVGLMKTHNCRQLPVMDGDKLVGIITDRDVRLAMNSPLTLHERADDYALLHHVPAEACMSPNPLTAEASMPVIEAARLLRTHKFGALPVVSGGKLVGILTTSDILASYIDLLSEQDSNPPG